MSDSTAASLQRGVIVEFDFAVLPGHKLMLDICQTRLAQDGITLDEQLMARMMNGKSFSSALNVLSKIVKKPIETSEITSECYPLFEEVLKKETAKIPSGFTAFIKALHAKNLKTVILTRADPEVVQEALTDLKGDNLVVSRDTASGFGFYSWDAWSRAARDHDLIERLCVAVVGSGYSVKAAMISGMGIIAKPNPLTEHQDFGGCDAVIDKLSASVADEVFRILHL